METLSTIGLLSLCIIIGFFTGIWGFFASIVIGAIYQGNYRRQQQKIEFERRLLEELREIKYKEGK